MTTKSYTLIGTNDSFVPVIAPAGTQFPSTYVKDFSSYCGAGHGIGEKVVPETIWGLRVSPACFIHDQMWDDAGATWKDFHHSNSVFLGNLMVLIEKQSKYKWLAALRNYRAITYFNFVDTVGAGVFWQLKHKQGLI